MKLDYKKVLQENLSEGAFAIITSSEKEFADWIDRVKRQSVRCDELFDELKKYNALENQCIAENQCGLRELLLKWKEFFDDIAELYDYRKAEEQGLLLRLPCKVGTPVYMVEQDCGGDTLDCRSGGCEGCEYLYRYIEENEFQLYMCEQIGKNVFFTREAAEAALAEKGGAE